MNDAELREFCTQMIGKFKLLSDIQKEMQYETIDAKFTEWELKKLIFALDVLKLTAEISNRQADTPQTELPKQIRTPYEGDIKVAPQTGTSTNSEKLQSGVEVKRTDCLTCRYNSDEWDSPKCDSCSKAHSNYEPQTDCAWK